MHTWRHPRSRNRSDAPAATTGILLASHGGVACTLGYRGLHQTEKDASLRVVFIMCPMYTLYNHAHYVAAYA